MKNPSLLWLWMSLVFAASYCHGNDMTVEVVGFGECEDCKLNNVNTNHAFSGLRVTVDCETADGDLKTKGVGELDEEGKFKVLLSKEILRDGELKEKCYAQLQSASATPCPSHDGLESSKIVFKSKTDGKHTFGPTGGLKFTSLTCASAFLWHYFHHPPLPPLSFPHFPPHPPLIGHPILLPPFPPIYKKPCPPLGPIYQKPLPPPVPVYEKPSPPPVPIYKEPIPPPVPIVKPLPPPIYKPKPPAPVYKPKPKPKPPAPVYKPPTTPVYKPKPPVYKAPTPVPVIYKPPTPVYVKPPSPTPVYKHPFLKHLPPIPKIPPCPPLPKVTTVPKLPPKYFSHPKFGKFPPHPPLVPHP